MQFRRGKRIWKPEIYQGKSDMRRYFEGWYFKIVDKSEKNIYAIIPGVSFDNEGNTHAFIMFFNGIKASMNYFNFDITDFHYSKKRFQIKIGKNSFHQNGFNLDINSNNQKIKGKINVKNLKPWPVKTLSPGAMGWYAFVPFMECYHAVIGFDHHLDGKININGNEIDFTGGRGYIEKDYGKSFPSYYIWMQSNHFETEEISVMASVAKIPWLGSSFDGFVVGFLFNGEVYRFATYTGAKIIKLQLSNNLVSVHFQDKKYRLELEAAKSASVDLHSPIEGSMTGRIIESITAKIHAKFVKISKNKEEILFDGNGRNAGLDIGGKIEELKEVS
ncbi:MAG: hypothetical protein KAT02_06465 [Candidatus Heimdallarchaeota archaeon]|nr:hypothetical protein [Candidatus Heimdallarchaeota archaeon]